MLGRLEWIRMLATFSETRLNSPIQASVHRFAKQINTFLSRQLQLDSIVFRFNRRYRPRVNGA